MPRPIPATDLARAGRRRLRRDFRLFWLGQAISNVGNSVTLFALPLLVFRLTGSALDLGIAGAADTLPYLLFGLTLGAWADRVDRRRAMISIDCARAAVVACLPIVAALGGLSAWWIYAVGFAQSTLAICFDVCQFAALPRLVEADELVAANGRIQATFSAAGIVGPFLAGLLVSVLPGPRLLLLDALSFLASALTLACVRSGFGAGSRATGKARIALGADVREGVRYVCSHPTLRALSIMMLLVNGIGGTVAAQLVLFAKQRLAASDGQVAGLYAAGGVGVVVFSLAAGTLRRRWPFGAIALGALMLHGLVIAVLSLTRSYWAAAALWAAGGGLATLFNITTSSLRQAVVPDRLLGRVASIASVLAAAGVPAGLLIGGAAVARIGQVAPVYGAIGVLLVLVPLPFALSVLGRGARRVPGAAGGARTSKARAVTPPRSPLRHLPAGNPRPLAARRQGPRFRRLPTGRSRV